jgi:peroxiredoxin Q/BCP
MTTPQLNSPAPDFTLPDQDGKEHTLSHHRGSWVLLYFYPKDNTTGCTKEACVLRDAFPSFGELKAKIFGVSVDSVASHKKFAEEYKLPFTLLADVDKKVVELYGVWGKKKFMGKEYEGTMRTSFLIDTQGKIVKIYENVKPETHAAEVLEDLKKITS